ncbi:hypothetical protein KHA80_09205 [Anaerobacillus sp. HL2]|nr:hypothetical protein KHA80_09205 [Anaerobacillus sp. HL2]
MGELTTNDIQKALKNILPKEIQFMDENIRSVFTPLIRSAQNDYGRGMMNSDLYGLTESITTNEKINYTSRVTTNNLDSFLLSTSLKAYLGSKNKKVILVI